MTTVTNKYFKQRAERVAALLADLKTAGVIK